MLDLVPSKYLIMFFLYYNTKPCTNMATSNSTTIGLIIGVIVAIIISSAALVMLVQIGTKVNSNDIHEENEAVHVSAPGVEKNEFYIFTQELNADEDKLGIPVAVFTLTQIVVHKGEPVTIHFINPAELPEDKHNFMMDAPYTMVHEILGGEKTTFTFVADTVGTFTYYCSYDLPSMVGTLVVLP